MAILGALIEDRADGTKLLFKHYLDGYRKRVNEFYGNEYESNHDYFNLMKPVKLTGVHFESNSLFLFSKSDTDSVMNIIPTNDQANTYIKYSDYPRKKIEEYVVEICEFRAGELINIIPISEFFLGWISFDKVNHHLLNIRGLDWGAKAADVDYNSLQIDQEVKRLSTPTSNYSLFDIETVINKVNDEDFKYEFEEAIKAYNTGLYLASTVTTAVSIETLLKIKFVEKFGIEKLPERFYSSTLANELKKHSYMDERLHRRILSTNNLRIGAAHSKTGKIEQWDAEQMIACVKIIVESLF